MDLVTPRTIRDLVEAGRLTATADECARLIGLSRAATYAGIRSGDIPSRRVGRRVLVPLGDLCEWLGVPFPTSEALKGGEE